MDITRHAVSRGNLAILTQTRGYFRARRFLNIIKNEIGVNLGEFRPAMQKRSLDSYYSLLSQLVEKNSIKSI